MRISIPGEPIAQQRPRFARRGRFVHTYNPQETEAGRWLLTARQQIKRKMEGALKVEIEAVFSRPKSHYGTGANATVLRSAAARHCTHKKDVDNIAKFALDCLNGEAWADDKQVVSLAVTKRWAVWGEDAATEIEVSEI